MGVGAGDPFFVKDGAIGPVFGEVEKDDEEDTLQRVRKGEGCGAASGGHKGPTGKGEEGVVVRARVPEGAVVNANVTEGAVLKHRSRKVLY